MPIRYISFSRKSFAFAYLIFIMALPSLACGLLTKPEPEPELEIGAKAPNFRLSTPIGDKIELNQLQGKVVLIAFWVSWCEECVQELINLQAAYEQHSEHDLVILGINSEDTAGKIVEFSHEHGITFPLLLDPNHEIADRYHLAFYPTSFLIDADGSLQASQTGGMKAHELESMLGGVLSYTRAAGFLQWEALDAPASALPIENPTPIPFTPTPAVTHLEGCVTGRGLKGRSSPSMDAAVLTYLNPGECFRFDGRSPEGTWLRLDLEWAKNNQRLWVSAAFIESPGDFLSLPIVSSGE